MQTSNLSSSTPGASAPGTAGAAAPGTARAGRAAHAATSNGTVALESLFVSAAAVAVALALAPADAALGAPGPHLAWLAVLVIAARYGTRGLLIALPVGAGVLTAVAWLLHRDAVLVARMETGADLAGMGAAVLVGWIASLQERRLGDLSARLRQAQRRTATDADLLRELQDALLSMRARTDRLEVSLSFLRDVSERLLGHDAQTAAQAALELAVARTGARAALVELSDAGAEVEAQTGSWTDDGSAANVAEDQTIAQALRTRRSVRAIDLREPKSTDADIAAPLLNADGQAIGFIAVRGVPYAGASLATLRDLAIISDWLATAVLRRGEASFTPLEAQDSYEHGLLMAMPYFEMRLLADPLADPPGSASTPRKAARSHERD